MRLRIYVISICDKRYMQKFMENKALRNLLNAESGAKHARELRGTCHVIRREGMVGCFDTSGF